MLCKLLGVKYGTFTDQKTGELVSFSKVWVCDPKPINVCKKGVYNIGQFPTEYKGRFLMKPAEEYVPFVGDLVDLKFDCVLGYKDPELVDIVSVPAEVRK